MAMDFFQHQEQARKHTGRLVVAFIAAVGMTVLAVYMLALVVRYFVVMQDSRPYDEVNPAFLYWEPRLFLAVTAGTAIVVLIGSLYKIAQLQGGGRVIAESLGGRLIDPHSRDFNERKVLNVVEEMAIASGTPVPPVYMMDKESGINAFAAGYSPEDAVIGVTRGCVETLTRDELQGVMAHEFSHILNGDMRLNIRLMGLIHGILVIALIGMGVLRSLRFARYAGSGNKKGGGGAIILAIVIGIGLLAIGYIGMFFGNLIKAAVSRQREYLADASAVQFTRNPDGIAGALKKIGGLAKGSAIDEPSAAQASHMFFGPGVSSLFATHPPLVERIRRIDPQFDGKLQKINSAGPSSTAMHERAAAVSSMVSQPVASAQEVQQAVEHIGNPTPQHLQYAADLMRQIPSDLRDAAEEPYGGRAVIYVLLLDKDEAVRTAQLDALSQHADKQVYDLTKKLASHAHQLDTQMRLPLTELAIRSLRSLTKQQFDQFMENVHQLVESDKRIDLFEWSMLQLISAHLSPVFSGERPPIAQYYALNRLTGECAMLLSMLAYVGTRDAQQVDAAFNAGARPLANVPAMSIQPRDKMSASHLESSLAKLRLVAPPLKRRIVEACTATVLHDRQVTTQEAELLRGIVAALGCPMPPILSTS